MTTGTFYRHGKRRRRHARKPERPRRNGRTSRGAWYSCTECGTTRHLYLSELARTKQPLCTVCGGPLDCGCETGPPANPPANPQAAEAEAVRRMSCKRCRLRLLPTRANDRAGELLLDHLFLTSPLCRGAYAGAELAMIVRKARAFAFFGLRRVLRQLGESRTVEDLDWLRNVDAGEIAGLAELTAAAAAGLAVDSTS